MQRTWSKFEWRCAYHGYICTLISLYKRPSTKSPRARFRLCRYRKLRVLQAAHFPNSWIKSIAKHGHNMTAMYQHVCSKQFSIFTSNTTSTSFHVSLYYNLSTTQLPPTCTVRTIARITNNCSFNSRRIASQHIASIHNITLCIKQRTHTSQDYASNINEWRTSGGGL